SVRRPGADQEKQGRERGNDSLARINCLPLSRDHLELPRASSFGWFLFAFGIVGQIVAEGVGFEPTVGFPTLDFESSALNRTQPPFLSGESTIEALTIGYRAGTRKMERLRIDFPSRNIHLYALWEEQRSARQRGSRLRS